MLLNKFRQQYDSTSSMLGGAFILYIYNIYMGHMSWVGWEGVECWGGVGWRHMLIETIQPSSLFVNGFVVHVYIIQTCN